METYYVIEEFLVEPPDFIDGTWKSLEYKYFSLDKAINDNDELFGFGRQTRIIKVTREVIEPEKTKVYY